jgi:hypothetical protein
VNNPLAPLGPESEYGKKPHFWVDLPGELSPAEAIFSLETDWLHTYMVVGPMVQVSSRESSA